MSLFAHATNAKGWGRLLVLSSYYSLGVCPLHSIIIGNDGHFSSRYSCNQDWALANHIWSNHPMGPLRFHVKYSIPSDIILWRLIRKVSIQKINVPVSMVKKKMTIAMKIKGVTRYRGQTLVGTWKGTSHWWVCNLAKFGGHVLRCSAYSLSNVISR